MEFSRNLATCNRTEGERPSSMYTSPFFLPPCFISRRRPSPSTASSIRDTEAGMALFLPPSLPPSLPGMILLNLLLSFRSAVAYWPRRQRCCLVTERGTRHCSFYHRDVRRRYRGKHYILDEIKLCIRSNHYTAFHGKHFYIFINNLQRALK